MITPGTNNEAGSAAMQLRQGDARLDLCILDPTTAAWKVIDTGTPRNPWDSPNRGTRMVAFECRAPASGELTFAVLATPGSCKRSRKDDLEVRPLETWGPR
jgi:hypothetical protein